MRTRLIFSALIVTAIAIGCRKNETAVPPADPIGGKGGRTTLKISGKHYTKELDSCTIYIKYNAETMPADMKFDDTANVKNVNGRYMVRFDSLKQGKYYLFAKGRDLNLVKPYDSLWGGTKYVIQDTLDHTYDLYINTINRYDELTLHP